MRLPHTSVPQRNHDLIYTIILGLLVAFTALSIELDSGTINMPWLDHGVRHVMILSRDVQLFYLLICVAIVIARVFFPTRRKWATLLFNVLILTYVPYGTLLGVYGLRKIDQGIQD